MATRPCKPDLDIKRLWRLLLPDAPMPNCVAQETRLKLVSDRTEPQDEAPKKARRRDRAANSNPD